MTTPRWILAGSLLLAATALAAEGFPPPPGPYNKTGRNPVELPDEEKATVFHPPANSEYRFAPLEPVSPDAPEVSDTTSVAPSALSEAPAPVEPRAEALNESQAAKPVVGYGAPADGYRFAPMTPVEEPIGPESPEAVAEASSAAPEHAAPVMEATAAEAAPPSPPVPAVSDTQYQFAPIPSEELAATRESASVESPVAISPAAAEGVALASDATAQPANPPAAPAPSAPAVVAVPAAPAQSWQPQPAQWGQPQTAPGYGYGYGAVYPQGYGQPYAPGANPSGGYWQAPGYGQPSGYPWRR